MPLLFSDDYYAAGSARATDDYTGRADSAAQQHLLDDYSQSFLQNTSLNHPLRSRRAEPPAPAQPAVSDANRRTRRAAPAPMEQASGPPAQHQANPTPMRLAKPTTFTYTNKIIPKSYQRRAVNVKELLEPLDKLKADGAATSRRAKPLRDDQRNLKLVKTKEGIVSRYE